MMPKRDEGMNDSEMMTKARLKGLSIHRANDGWWTMTHPTMCMLSDVELSNHLSNLRDASWFYRFMIWAGLW